MTIELTFERWTSSPTCLQKQHLTRYLQLWPTTPILPCSECLQQSPPQTVNPPGSKSNTHRPGRESQATICPFPRVDVDNGLMTSGLLEACLQGTTGSRTADQGPTEGAKQVPYPKVSYTQGFLSQVWEQSLAKAVRGRGQPHCSLEALLSSMAPEVLVPEGRCSGQSEGSLGHREAWKQRVTGSAERQSLPSPRS